MQDFSSPSGSSPASRRRGSGVGASNGFRPSGIVYHSGASAVGPLNAAVRTTGTFDCGAITCDAFKTGVVNTFLQDVAHDSGGSNNVYSVATQYADTTGNVAYTETFGGTYTDTHSFPSNTCAASPGSVCLDESQLVTEIQTDMTRNSWTGERDEALHHPPARRRQHVLRQLELVLVERLLRVPRLARHIRLAHLRRRAVQCLVRL